MSVRSLEERLAGRLGVAGEQFPEGVRRVETGNPARAALRVAGVVVPEDLAVRGIEERDAEAVEVQGLCVAPREYRSACVRTFCGPSVTFLASTTPRRRPSAQRA